MSVLTFKEIHNGRSGSDSVNDKGIEVKYVRVYRVTTDDATDTAEDILSHASCPGWGNYHPDNTHAFVKSRTATNEAFSKKVWIATIQYSTSSKEYQSSPLDDPAKVTWDTEQFQRVAFKDKDGDAIVNSATDFYDPPPERDDSRWAVVVSKNVAAVPTWLIDYQDAINSVPFVIGGLTIAAYAAKMQAIRICDIQWRESVSFYVLTMTITLAKDTHILKVLDQGFNKLVSGSGGDTLTKIFIPDADGTDVEATTPVLLDGSGAQLTSPSPSTAVFNEHHVYAELDFNALPLV